MGHLSGKKAFRDLQQWFDKLPPAQAAMANRKLQSHFGSAMTGAFKKGVQEARVAEAEA